MILSNSIQLFKDVVQFLAYIPEAILEYIPTN